MCVWARVCVCRARVRACARGGHPGHYSLCFPVTMPLYTSLSSGVKRPLLASRKYSLSDTAPGSKPSRRSSVFWNLNVPARHGKKEVQMENKNFAKKTQSDASCRSFTRLVDLRQEAQEDGPGVRRQHLLHVLHQLLQVGGVGRVGHGRHPGLPFSACQRSHRRRRRRIKINILLVFLYQRRDVSFRTPSAELN